MFKAFGKLWQKERAAVPTREDVRDLWLGPGTYFEGTLQCQSNVVLGGRVENSRIETSANILIAESAQVTAALSACIVSVRGQYAGNLVADRAEFLAGAHVAGQVHVNSIYMDEQARMDAALFLLDPDGSEAGLQVEEITADVVTRTVHGPSHPPVEIGT